MFNASEIREMVTAKEFKPFVIYTTDGARYEITNHDMLLVTRNSLHIGLATEPDGIAERVVRCAIIHVTRIEDLQAV
jgi:anaerobic glycerol-3-phosphate dehydrogenase